MSSFLYILLFATVVWAERHGLPSRTLSVYKDSPHETKRSPILIDSRRENDNLWSAADSVGDSDPSAHRTKRSIAPENANITTRVNRLNDSHSLLMVHWAGEGSDVVLCLARDPILHTLVSTKPSALYISYDYGDTFVNKTELLRLNSGKYAVVEKFYNHHKFNKHVVLTDVTNQVVFTTRDSGQTMQQYKVDFNPSDVVFHENDPFTFLVYDKVDPLRKLYVTKDFGVTWTKLQESVKSFYWAAGVPSASTDMADGETELPLISNNTKATILFVERLEPSGVSTILASSDFFTKNFKVLIKGVQDFHVKGDFMFASRAASGAKQQDGKTDLDLFVSYKRGPFVKALFQTDKARLRYHIADVSGSQAMVAVVHDTQAANLYVSVDVSQYTAKFAISLENIFCYMPNVTWKDSWLEDVTEEPFTTLTKVEGLRGIYIASVVTSPNKNGHIGLENLSTMITFDRGGQWRPLNPPQYDDDGNPVKCEVKDGCSLHLAQSFAHLFPQTRSVPILTSKSAPGIILATGTVGKSLKGHPGVFLSTDAGVTWRQVLKDIYFFNFGDHGGVIVAVKYYKSRGETRQILYSTDEGQTFSAHNFTDGDLRMYGLMTEPGGNTTVFTMFGSAKEKHQWIIVKVDMKNAFKYNCTDDDYKFWSPGSGSGPQATSGSGVRVPCLLGKTETFQRRLPHSNCYNSRNYVRRVKIEVCGCDAEDFDCDYGFKRDLDHSPIRCVRDRSAQYDPYGIPLFCVAGKEKFYNRTKGYRKVPGDVCIGGNEDRFLPDRLPCPMKEKNDFLLAAQRDRIIRIDLETNKIDHIPILNLRNVIAIEFDMKNNCIYWADIVTDTIGRQCLQNGTDPPEVLVSTNMKSVEGMAYDWVSQLLYFVDGARATIEVIRTDVSHQGRMRRTILKSPDLKKPRGIVVHPKAGYMFWTDWTPERPSVNRANLDGSNIKQLFQGSKEVWPNGITIDHIAERVYWVDAREDYIASCNLDGNHVVKVITNDPRVSHPFAVAVFKDNVYWDDWKQNAIFTADKDHGKAIQNITQGAMLGLMDLKVYAHSIQEGTNACSNTSACSHICVGAPNKGFSCLCPDEMEMKDGMCMCPGGKKPFDNGTCPQVAQTCAPNFFTCANGVCAPEQWRCDNVDDCGDGSDELNCTRACGPKQFRCSDGTCISPMWRCDMDKDCEDGSDEICGAQNCTELQFKCGTGHCIDKKWVCDQENDCFDGSDEANCKHSTTTQCPAGEFKCGNRSQCVPNSWRCDGEKDCSDGSDEKNCKDSTCEPYQFTCVSGNPRCISVAWRCDNSSDCEDGSDEVNCTMPVPPSQVPVLPPPFRPMKNDTCPEWMFLCNNKHCIPDWWKCDRVDDCGDKSDEMGCGFDDSGEDIFPDTSTELIPRVNSCPPNFFQCLTGECIPDAWVCDKTPECSKEEDEQHCNPEGGCRYDQFMCRTDGSCLNLANVCDGVPQCPDGSDELSCQSEKEPTSVPTRCLPGHFSCLDGSCMPASALCDGIMDCMDGFDEHNCTKDGSRIYQVLQMGVDERVQDSTSLLLYWLIALPKEARLEYLPSISEVVPQGRQQAAVWRNHTKWIDVPEHQFTNLTAYTEYNMTVYVRVRGKDVVFPPAKFLTAMTAEDTPSEPWNVTATQVSGSEVVVKWQPPLHPRGEILGYIVFMTPPMPAITLPMDSYPETGYVVRYDFEPNTTYSFWVVAQNNKAESVNSRVSRLEYDEKAWLDKVQGLSAVSHEGNKLFVQWKPVQGADNYEVVVQAPSHYPELDPLFTTNTSLEIPNLAPGLSYLIKVCAHRKSSSGPLNIIPGNVPGTPLPKVDGLRAEVVGAHGTDVKVSWNPVKDDRSKKWKYGIYYGLTEYGQMKKPKLISENTSVLLQNLQPCETYLIAVGLVGPLGYGPVTPLQSRRAINTLNNPKAMPKHLGVRILKETFMAVHWNASCPSANSNLTRYVVTVTETTMEPNRVSSITMLPTNATYIEAHFRVRNGGRYNITVETDVPDALVAGPVTFIAPPIPAPHQFIVQPENGSYTLDWKDDDYITASSGSTADPHNNLYQFEVLVSEGRVMNESKAERFLVPHPPFTLTQVHEGTLYTFAVRLVTTDGYKSSLSEIRSIEVPLGSWTAAVKSGVLYYTLVPGFVLVLGLVAALVFFMMRHRRLQHSFASFANSHYDTRSGAATFGGADGLEEEDSPVIRGFSDDEPLVIA